MAEDRRRLGGVLVRRRRSGPDRARRQGAILAGGNIVLAPGEGAGVGSVAVSL